MFQIRVKDEFLIFLFVAFDICCQPFIQGIAKLLTAEALMRSRYSAYAILAVDFIIKTPHRSTCELHDSTSIRKWEQVSFWKKLEILSKQIGVFSDTKSLVEFRSYYQHPNQQSPIHHEYSSFMKEVGEQIIGYIEKKLSNTFLSKLPDLHLQNI